MIFQRPCGTIVAKAPLTTCSTAAFLGHKIFWPLVKPDGNPERIFPTVASSFCTVSRQPSGKPSVVAGSVNVKYPAADLDRLAAVGRRQCIISDLRIGLVADDRDRQRVD